jgi:GTP-binding protein
MNLRNVAIIAHVDHGKTTLVDAMFRQGGVLRAHERVAERAMDSNELERERGITILAKNTAVHYGDTLINIMDTPGHADFGGEVERVLSMADGVVLLVDAAEGPLPQTRFVLRKAFERGLPPIVVINKIDRSDARAKEVLNEVYDLFIDLDATEEQIEFPVLYTSGRAGTASTDLDVPGEDLRPLFDAIITHVPPPRGDVNAPLQMLVSNLDASDYLGRIAIGRIFNGKVHLNDAIVVCKLDGQAKETKVTKLFTFDGLRRIEVEEAFAGDIICLAGIEDISIGETITDPEHRLPIAYTDVDEPTVSMIFGINTSPLAGKEGQFVTSRHLRERLERELRSNVAMKVERTDSADSWKISGRGVLHLGVFLETMRREGFEFAVGKPRVITKEIHGQKHEPVEMLIVDVRTPYAGKVIELVGGRRGEVQKMESVGENTHLEIEIPARGLVGLRTKLLTATTGEAVMHHTFVGYRPWKGPIGERQGGVQVAVEGGKVGTYALDALQDRGSFFVSAGDEVYVGQIVGEHCRGIDITVNPTKTKKLSNMRASGSDRKLVVAPPKILSLEECLEYIEDDELVEVTPKSLRMRKILLDENDRKRAKNRAEQAEEQSKA